MALPILVVAIPLVLVPGILLIRLTLLGENAQLTGINGAWTLSVYESVLRSPFYWRAIGGTILLGATTVILTILLGLPYGYWMLRHPRSRTLLTMVLVLPLTVNVVVRLYGWQLLLSQSGPINWLTTRLGHSPLTMLSTWPAVLVALVHVTLPIIALTSYGAMRQLDANLIDAARTLGTAPSTALLRVVIPACAPGIAAGAAIAFGLAAGSFLVPVVLGGGRVNTVPVLVYQDAQTSSYALAGCLAVLLVAIVLPFMVWNQRRR